MSPSYGHTYLTSYGWTGAGTGLRNGAIVKPLAIPPKKNLSGLGKDRDEAFPFWDHLFAAASKAISIKVSNDSEDLDENKASCEEPSSHADTDTDPSSPALRRTTTGILSNRRPVSGAPAATSDPAVAVPRQSLLATAKREAAKRGLYARFFRGPVLGPVHSDDTLIGAPSCLASPSPSFEESESGSNPRSRFVVSTSVSMPVPEHIDNRGETEKSRKRNSKDGMEKKKRKRLKRERKAARSAERAEKALSKEKAKGKKVRLDDAHRKARKQRDEEARSEREETSLPTKNAPKRARKPAAVSEGDDLEPEKHTREKMKMEPAQHDTSHGPRSGVDITNACNVVLATKRKKQDTS